MQSPAACQTVADVASANPDLSTLVAALSVSGRAGGGGGGGWPRRPTTEIPRTSLRLASPPPPAWRLSQAANATGPLADPTLTATILAPTNEVCPPCAAAPTP